MIHIRYEGGPKDGKTEEVAELRARRMFVPPLLPPSQLIGPRDPAEMMPPPIIYYYAGSDPQHGTGHLYKYYDAEAH